MKENENRVKKRRVILAKLLLENSHYTVEELIHKLGEYNIKSVTRQTIHRDKEYLKAYDLKKFLRSDTMLYLEIRHKKITDKIAKLESMQEKEEDKNTPSFRELEKIIVKYTVIVGKIEKDLDELAIKKIEIEKPVYNVTIGTQKVVDVTKYKSQK